MLLCSLYVLDMVTFVNGILWLLEKKRKKKLLLISSINFTLLIWLWFLSIILKVDAPTPGGYGDGNEPVPPVLAPDDSGDNNEPVPPPAEGGLIADIDASGLLAP